MHVSGKLMYAADVLSRCPTKQSHPLHIITKQETVESHISATTMQLPVSEGHSKVYRTAQQ